MESPWETYQKNLWCLQKVTDRLLGHMKGCDYSFKQDITDRKGSFDEEKLRALVEELLSGWEKKLYRADTDPATGESVAEPWLRERREMYGVYLYGTTGKAKYITSSRQSISYFLIKLTL